MDLHSGLYTVTNHSKGYWDVHLASASHPVFQAHFEDNPLLPGFMQIEIAARLLKEPTLHIKKARFFMPVKPDETLTYTLDESGDIHRWRIERSGKKVAEFSLL